MNVCGEGEGNNVLLLRNEDMQATTSCEYNWWISWQAKKLYMPWAIAIDSDEDIFRIFYCNNNKGVHSDCGSNIYLLVPINYGTYI